MTASPDPIPDPIPAGISAADRPMLGIAMMTGFCILAPLADGLTKFVGATVPLLLVVTVRFATQSLILAPLVARRGRGLRMTRRVFALTLLRTALHVTAIALLFIALQFLPLADAIAIVFVMPFMLLLLGRLVLGEEVGPRRLGACGVGFGGTLLVMQPSFLDVGAVVVLPLFVALLFALFMLITRAIARDTDAITLQAMSGVQASVVLIPLTLLLAGSGHPALGYVAPTGREWAILATMGVLGTVGHLLMTGALRHAPAATLAPMQYLEIPFATLIGWLMFRDLPDGLAALGIVVTVASGLYIVAREHRISRAPRPIPPLPDPLPERSPPSSRR